MLLKLDTVEEIGRFSSLSHKAPHFAPLTLIFARNGYGKSTICSILRSASDGEASHIHTRKRLGAKRECRVQSKWAGSGDVIFSSGKWNISPGRVHIFDQEYVSQNLHVGESVTRDNKRSLLPVVLGATGVALAQKINALDAEQRELTGKMKTSEGIIRAKCPIVSPVNMSAFCIKAVPDDIEAKIVAATRDVELAKQAIAVKQKRTPAGFSLEPLRFYKEIAARTITNLSEDAANLVRLHIERYGLKPRGDRWLEYGVEHISDDSCPFCEQSLSGLDLIAAYQAYFSDAFARLLADRDKAIDSLNHLCIEDGARIDSIANENDADFEFWKQVCDITNPPTQTPEQRLAIKQGLLLLLKVMEQKIADPLKVVLLGEHAVAIEAAFALASSYDVEISKHISTIEEARNSVATADLLKAEARLQQWLALEAKLSEPVKTQAELYRISEVRKAKIELDKKTAQSNLTAYAKATIESRQNEINDLLSDFGANFSIIDTKANFVGREPNTEYSIAIGANKIKAGEKSDTDPSFKTVLSAGDKTTLALAFFLSQVRSDPELGEAVIAFDDPFNSQDMQRQFETTSQIRAIADAARQTIVFSHDPRFLQMIDRDANGSSTKTFQLACADSGEGAISLWSISDELKSEYVRQAESIREYASQGRLLKNDTQSSLIKDMRPFLEDYIRARFPGRFQLTELLSVMTDAIEAVGNEDPMFSFVPDLRAINEYTRGSHHGGGQTPDPVALRAQCKRIIRIIGGY